MTEQIKVVVKRAGKPPETIVIDNTLKTMQTIVGGLIEIPYNPDLPKGVDLICNEEGKLLDLEPNLKWGDSDIICGNVIFAAHNDDGEHISLTPEQIDQAEIFSIAFDAGLSNERKALILLLHTAISVLPKEISSKDKNKDFTM